MISQDRRFWRNCCLMLTLAWSPAFSQPAVAPSLGDCRADEAAATALPACTALVDTGKLAGADLAAVLAVRAQIWRVRNELGRAVADLSDAVRFAPTDVDFRLARGAALRDFGKPDEALADADEAIRLAPASEKAHLARADLLHMREDSAAAIAAYSTVLKLNPTNSFAFFRRAYNENRIGNKEAALTDYSEAIRLSAKYAYAYWNRGIIRGDRKDFDGALGDLDEAIRLRPADTGIRLSRAYVLADKNDLPNAIAECTAIIGLDPENATAYFRRALYQARTGNKDAAVADYGQAIRIDPKYVAAYQNRGTLHSERKDFDGALADLDEAIRLAPNQRSHGLRGDILVDKKDYAGAVAEYSAVIALNPNSPRAFFQRARNEARLGRKDAALADYSEAIRLNPKATFAYENRGIIRRGRKDLDGAIADFNQAVEIDPDNTGALAHRGLAYEAKGDVIRAREDFTKVGSLPVKYDNGQWAANTAKARLAVLTAPVPTKTAAVPLAGPPAKVALVIGNGAYVTVPKLPNPAADAKAMAAGLRDMGFTVIEGTNLDRRGMEEKIVTFLRAVSGSQLAMVFYAGHGVEIDGRNYLVPVDAKDITRTTLTYELVDVGKLLSGLDDESRANIVILDACRNNPLGGRGLGRASGGETRGGLAAYADVASGMLIAFSTSPSKTAADGTGTNSPFTSALLKHLKAPVEINEMLRLVRVDVYGETHKEQIPWANSSLLGQVYLSGGDGTVAK